MSWHDPARYHEPAEDRALREELSQLLGLPSRRFFEAEPTPKMIALAHDLHREALRRRHTSRRKPMWMMMAASLPLMFALSAVGVWGFQHKRRADDLAAAVLRQESQIRLMTQAVAEAKAKGVQPAPSPAVAIAPVAPRVTTQPRPVLVRHSPAPAVQAPPAGELVIEVRPSTTPMPTETQVVKQRGQ